MDLLVDVATATRELRIILQAGEDADLTRKLSAAQEQVAVFLGRNVYADQDTLNAAKSAAPGIFQTATEAYGVDLEAARGLGDCEQRDVTVRLVKDTYSDAVDAYVRTSRAIVVNDSIRTAILLTAASLWEHRGDEDAVQGVPPAAERMLWPFRTGLGV